jgi:hypothetical protein
MAKSLDVFELIGCLPPLVCMDDRWRLSEMGLLMGGIFDRLSMRVWLADLFIVAAVWLLVCFAL